MQITHTITHVGVYIRSIMFPITTTPNTMSDKIILSPNGLLINLMSTSYSKHCYVYYYYHSN